jgi:hypothetical protein
MSEGNDSMSVELAEDMAFPPVIFTDLPLGYLCSVAAERNAKIPLTFWEVALKVCWLASFPIAVIALIFVPIYIVLLAFYGWFIVSTAASGICPSNKVTEGDIAAEYNAEQNKVYYQELESYMLRKQAKEAAERERQQAADLEIKQAVAPKIDFYQNRYDWAN